MRSLYVALPDDAVDQLRALASRERRAPRHQAAVLILDGLRREKRRPKGRDRDAESVEVTKP